MKKVIAILMALAVCGTVAYTACAEEAAEENVDVVAAAEETVDTLLDNEKAMDMVDDLKTALANNGDIAAVYEKIAGYVGDVSAAGSGRDAVDKFLTDAGVDTEVLNDAISKSVVANKVLDIYYKPTEEPVEETTEKEEVSIPDTDFQF